MTVRRAGLCLLMLVALGPGLVATVPAGSPESTETADEVVDWVVAKAEVATATRIETIKRVVGHRTDTGPLVIGTGWSTEGTEAPRSYITVRRFGGGSVQATMAVGPGPGGVDLAVTIDEDGSFVIEHGTDEWAGVRSVAHLTFVVNGVIDDVTWSAEAPRSDTASEVVTSVTVGAGSTAVHLDQNGDGSNAAVGAASIGVGRQQSFHDVATGIAGAFESYSCHACTASWLAPDGRFNAWQSASYQDEGACWCWVGVAGDATLAGPRGRWHLDWGGLATGAPAQPGRTGELVSQPVVAAWAPIGDDWRLFSR